MYFLLNYMWVHLQWNKWNAPIKRNDRNNYFYGKTMATIDLRPGDTVNIIWKSVQETPMGLKEIDSVFPFTYEELIKNLGYQRKAGRSKRSSTSGARFSRMVALSANALKKGQWSNGGDIDRSVVFQSLMKRFDELDSREYQNMTGRAKRTISELVQHKEILSPAQRTQLEQMLTLIS